MRSFDEYIITGDVRPQAPDRRLADATATTALERLALAKSILGTQKPKFALENAFEAIREMIDAVLFLRGFKSYSHEASVAYLQELSFSQRDLSVIDGLRKQRNGIKYYGDDATREEAGKAIQVAEWMIVALRRVLR